MGIDTVWHMSKRTIIAKLTAADGKSDELETALAGLVAAAEEESGLEIYSAHAANDEPGVFWFFELYSDEDALAAHGRGEGMRAAMGTVGGLLAGAPELIMATPVVAKGLDI